MEINISNNPRVSSLFIMYFDGQNAKKLAVKVRYIDKKECYLSSETPVNFTKPKKNTHGTIMAYTELGVYSAEIKIKEVNLSSLHEITFSTTAPKNWEYKQLRTSARKKIKIPFNIKFNDGYEIIGITNDISIGGFSFATDTQLPNLYKQFIGKLFLEFTGYANMENIVADVKFLRENDNTEGNDGRYFYIFRITELGQTETTSLKNFIINAN